VARFLSRLVTEKECLENCKDKASIRRHKLVEPFIYQSDLLPIPLYIHRGFSTDFASYFGREGTAGSVVHDFLYHNHILYKLQIGDLIVLASSDYIINRDLIKEKIKVGKLKADAIFKEAMIISNDPPSTFRRFLIWQAVVWGGWLAYWQGGKKSTKN